MVVHEFGPWKVVDSEPDKFVPRKFIVVDSSGGVPVPVKVYGPATKADCMAWARVSFSLWVSLNAPTDVI